MRKYNFPPFITHKPQESAPTILQGLMPILVVFVICVYLTSCKKLMKIDQPVNSITTDKVFSDNATADAAVVGIYSRLINAGGVLKSGNGGITLYSGLSSDELSAIGLPDPSNPLSQFYTNALFSDNANVNNLWTSAFFAIYQANSCIEGIEKSKSVSSDVASRLIGECKFLRAFCFFYLTNLWGDVPLALSSDWNQTYSLHRAPKTNVYDQIISDLKDAQNLLPDDYSLTNNDRTRATKYAATALLARTYLYRKSWADAEIQATTVINNSGTFSMVNDLNKVFLKNSTEAILQFEITAKSSPYINLEQYSVVSLSFSITDSLLKAFDNSDQRKSAWIKKDSTKFPGIKYSYPYKYKVNGGSASTNISEYYMVLRLAEQYLIRAEARANLGNVSGAQADLNSIRTRAGLPNTTANSQITLLNAILQERRVELFAEWGHRWFDLIRTESVNEVLVGIKGASWQSTDQLYPIPSSEIINNSNLVQNPNY